jgi:hypothetical protein
MDCGVKLTDENRYKTVRSRCKSCHIKKVKGNDLTVPPKAPPLTRMMHCRGCGTEILRNKGVYCVRCSDILPDDDFPDMRTSTIRQYHKLGIQEHLPAALAEIDRAIKELS